MIVFGDRTGRVRTADRITDINADLRLIANLGPGLSRHSALAGTFIALGQIVQGVADADLASQGFDGASAAEIELMNPLCALARAMISSWDSSFALLPPLPDIPIPRRAPEEVELRLPEGYAYYAVYPEAYAHTARNLGLQGETRVIGIRSIGTSLSAMTAAALDAPPPITVRPGGHPFHRRIAISPDASARLLGDRESDYIVVDEGPGLSGSSFAAAADILAAQGVPPRRIHFLASHAGAPGNQASEAVRRRWAEVRRTPATDDALPLSERLASWASELLGPLDGPLVDISGGAWRRLIWSDERYWPAVVPHQERRKFLARIGGDTWLLKFAGLGAEGEARLAAARSLHAAGFAPEVRGLLYGFLVQRWERAMPLGPGDPAPIDSAARYLAARVRLLPKGGQGATIARLHEMAQHNIRCALGAAAASVMDRWVPFLDVLQARSTPVQTDNRCDAHEWLRLPDGHILKADALDHHASHDLIGCQDIAWDVAGLSAEFDMREDQTEELIARLDRLSDRPVDRELLAFLTPCYLAFRLASAMLAADSLSGHSLEADRNRAAARRYAARIGAVPAGP